MNNKNSIRHPIQQRIVATLTRAGVTRFRDLRPAKTETNLFTYHLQSLMKAGIIEKTSRGYTLSTKGLSYVDHALPEAHPRLIQPKIITMLVIQNENGDILLQRRDKQPYIDTWTLPYGKLHIEDKSVKKAAQRTAFDRLGVENPDLEHAGDVYIRVKSKGILLSTTLVHVFRAYREYEIRNDTIVWARPHKLDEYSLSPAVEEIMTRTFFKDPFYFEEFEVDW